MDVVTASHLEVIKRFLEDNPGSEFKMRKSGSSWFFSISMDAFDELGHVFIADTFTDAVTKMSKFLGEMGNDNASSGNG